MIHENKATVMIKGLAPGMLMHNPLAMFAQDKGGRKKIPSPEDAARDALYWTEDKTSIAFPETWLRSGLIRAASGYKLPPPNKKMSMVPIIAGDISFSPTMISLKTTTYEIDIRKVMVQRQGILRARPWFKEWQATFEIHWEAQYLGADFHKSMLPELLERLGKTIGVGDFRPTCKGPFGRFEVVSIK